ncbi:2694_t:CDS:2 [Ambispora gerdemannii]|uniref:2694_t:CDS:1 n=1 Tax=Ambispora gerdemannii TaxID=144530 RepID=A0A9N9DTB2_9GLOM|nr:2694_t:CDS:2 [Ambispora gerdemannii]
MSVILENFPKRTQKIVHEWASIVRTKYAIPEAEDDELYAGDPLFIIEWNEAALQQRQIQKTAVINVIRSFQGCRPFPQNAQPQSEAIFYIVDTPNIQAQQIVSNILFALQTGFCQRRVPNLGRIYVIVAEKKNDLRITEFKGIFSF